MPEEYNQSVYEIFGGLKKKWPTLKTIAVLNWETFPSDLPLDVWVDSYSDYGVRILLLLTLLAYFFLIPVFAGERFVPETDSKRDVAPELAGK